MSQVDKQVKQVRESLLKLGLYAASLSMDD
jgi:hypothetical protein